MTTIIAVEPGAKSAPMPQGTRQSAHSVAAAAAFREKLPQHRHATSCTARVGARRAFYRVRRERCWAANVSFRWKPDIPQFKVVDEWTSNSPIALQSSMSVCDTPWVRSTTLCQLTFRESPKLGSLFRVWACSPAAATACSALWSPPRQMLIPPTLHKESMKSTLRASAL